jgi:hypothetical protein
MRWYLPTSPHNVTTQKTNTDGNGFLVSIKDGEFLDQMGDCQLIKTYSASWSWLLTISYLYLRLFTASDTSALFIDDQWYNSNIILYATMKSIVDKSKDIALEEDYHLSFYWLNMPRTERFKLKLHIARNYTLIQGSTYLVIEESVVSLPTYYCDKMQIPPLGPSSTWPVEPKTEIRL